MSDPACSSCRSRSDSLRRRLVGVRRHGDGVGPGRGWPDAVERDRLVEIAAGQDELLSLELELVADPLAAQREQEAVGLEPPADRLLPVARARIGSHDDRPRSALLALLEIELPGAQ